MLGTRVRFLAGLRVLGRNFGLRVLHDLIGVVGVRDIWGVVCWFRVWCKLLANRRSDVVVITVGVFRGSGKAVVEATFVDKFANSSPPTVVLLMRLVAPTLLDILVQPALAVSVARSESDSVDFHVSGSSSSSLEAACEQ